MQGEPNSSATVASQADRHLDMVKMLPEALMAGCIGAGIIALWFLILDVIGGQPLYTPMVLGTVLFQQSAEPIALLVPGVAYCSSIAML